MAKMPHDLQSAPLFRRELKSLEACLEIFQLDEDGYLADAVHMAAKPRKRRGHVPPITTESAAHECGLALWKAISTFNEHRLLHGGPDYEVLGLRQHAESDSWDKFEGGERAEQIASATPSKIIARLRRSPTQYGKFSLLAEEAGKIAEMIDDLVAGLDFVHRTGIIGKATKNIDVSNEKDRARMRALLQEEKARLQTDNGLRGIQYLLARMAEHKARGGAPGHVFQQEFLKHLIPYWNGLFGELPAREDTAFLTFVASAYEVFSARDFDGWESVLRTALKPYGKTSQEKQQGSD